MDKNSDTSLCDMRKPRVYKHSYTPKKTVIPNDKNVKSDDKTINTNIERQVQHENHTHKRKLKLSTTEKMKEKKKRPSVSGETDNSDTYSVSTHNSYEELSEVEGDIMILNEEGEYIKLKPTTITPNECDSEHQNLTDNPAPIPPTQANNTKQGTRKPPPIKVYNIAHKTAIKNITTTLKHDQFSLKAINPNMSNIYTNNLLDYHKVIKLLKDNQINHYTHTPQELKPINILLKGIDTSFNNEDITLEINNLKLKITLITIIDQPNTNYTNKYTRHNTKVVQMEPGSDVFSLTKIKYLLHQRVFWEKRLPNKTTQCFNCQRFGHSARNCGMIHRCVKCTDSHPRGECKTTTSDATQVQPGDGQTQAVACINCGQSGHPANYKKCPVYQNYIQKLQVKKEQLKMNTEFKQQSYNRFVRPNLSYASMSNNTHTDTRNTKQSKTHTI